MVAAASGSEATVAALLARGAAVGARDQARPGVPPPRHRPAARRPPQLLQPGL